ncbi:MAG TPA: polymer-forming cytoskeletal protein [Gammaproteobacteria bacterium]|nr:polymer-forming cytoskeletal protein [Gammaproteobacteria bacterium]
MARDDHHSPMASPATDTSAPRRPAASREAAVIGPSITIDGDLRGDEDLVIEGEVSGTVQLKGNSLTIGSKGKVTADVYAHSIHVEGFLEGDLYGAERVSIRKSAQIRGNITSPRVSLEDGARFKGSIEMDPQAVEAALGTRRSGAGEPAPKPAAPSFKPGGDAGKTEFGGKR